MADLGVLDVIAKFSTKLQELDIHVVDVNLFVREAGYVKYDDYEQLRKDIVSGNAYVFFTVEAIIGDDAWDFLDD